MKETTLTSIFNARKNELTDKLKTMYLPADSANVEKAIFSFLNELFQHKGEYRQSLTESEDYILQAAIDLLQASQNLTSEIASSAAIADSTSKKVANEEPTPYYIAGASLGALIGSIVWGHMGAIIGGAVTGGAATAFYKNRKGTGTKEAVRTTLNVADVASTIVEKICASIDKLMSVYRVQIQRTKDSFARREQPTLQNTYGALLDQVVTVYNTVKSLGDAVPPKVQVSVDALAESLENYDLTIENGKIANIK